MYPAHPLTLINWTQIAFIPRWIVSQHNSSWNEITPRSVGEVMRSVCPAFSWLHYTYIQINKHKAQVGFGRAARIRVFRLIYTQTGRCAPPPPSRPSHPAHLFNCLADREKNPRKIPIRGENLRPDKAAFVKTIVHKASLMLKILNW